MASDSCGPVRLPAVQPVETREKEAAIKRAAKKRAAVFIGGG
jgi:hypothetical protein